MVGSNLAGGVLRSSSENSSTREFDGICIHSPSCGCAVNYSQLDGTQAGNPRPKRLPPLFYKVGVDTRELAEPQQILDNNVQNSSFG